MEKRDVSYYYKAAQSNKTKVAMRQLRGIFIILSSLFVSSCAYLQAPKITVKNLSGDFIFDITISGNGFRESIKRIKPGESITITVYPNGESDINLEFRGKSGVIVKNDLSYIEPRDGTHTILTITPAMKIETKIERIF